MDNWFMTGASWNTAYVYMGELPENPTIETIFITCVSIFAGIRMQLFSFAGQIFQFKTLDCSTIRCNTLELSIASKNPEVYASTNNTLNLVIEDFGKVVFNDHSSFISSIGYSESCCQYVTFFRHYYE